MGKKEKKEKIKVVNIKGRKVKRRRKDETRKEELTAVLEAPQYFWWPVYRVISSPPAVGNEDASPMHDGQGVGVRRQDHCGPLTVKRSL